MPKITIYEKDNTGSTYNGDEINVFVPGDCSELDPQPLKYLTVETSVEKTTAGESVYVSFIDPDTKETYYIKSISSSTITVEKPTEKSKPAFSKADGKLTTKTVAYTAPDANKFDITFDSVKNVFTVIKYVAEHAFDMNDCMLIPVGSKVEDYLKAGTDKSYTYVQDLLNAGLGIVYYRGAISGQTGLAFLNDYNAYNVEILTMGAPSSIPPIFDDTLAKNLISVCSTRKDCFALIDYPTKTSDTMLTVSAALSNALTGAEGKYAAAFVDWDIKNMMPGSYAYLMKLADANVGGKRWDSISGVQRGVVGDTYTTNVAMDKYILDNSIQTKKGISYNGIVNVRPYGWTIWGDRTLYSNSEGTGLVASSFLSIRLMICDIVKRAYNAAINNTFESNNDITWVNYKTEIQELLDRMVASGKLASYKFVKKPTTKRATIACAIRLVPVEPVEDFDIYIDLQNGSAEVTEG